MKNRGTTANSPYRKVANTSYADINSATLPNNSALNYTSNVTEYFDDQSGLNMVDMQPKPLLCRNKLGKKGLKIDLPSKHDSPTNYVDI